MTTYLKVIGARGEDFFVESSAEEWTGWLSESELLEIEYQGIQIKLICSDEQVIYCFEDDSIDLIWLERHYEALCDIVGEL